jgi:hypothetical protein
MGKFNFNNEEFDKIKAETENFYKTIGSVLCPYFKEKIAFNAKGLRHLKFKSDQQARSHQDQCVRLKLLYLAPEIIKKSHTLQGIWKIRRFETQNINSRWEHAMKDVIFYEFIAVLDNIRVKVIVKEVQGGEKYFWSIIPYWGIDKINSKRVLYSGDPEHD